MSQFPRLYRIASFKHCTVRFFVERFNSPATVASLWTRPLLDRDEHHIRPLSNLLLSIKFKADPDKLFWAPGNGSFFSKKFSQNCLRNTTFPSHSIGNWNLIWAVKLIPKNQSFFGSLIGASYRLGNFSVLKCRYPPLCVHGVLERRNQFIICSGNVNLQCGLRIS